MKWTYETHDQRITIYSVNNCFYVCYIDKYFLDTIFHGYTIVDNAQA